MGGTLDLTATRLVFLPLINREAVDVSNRAAKVGERLHRQLGQQHYISSQRLLNAAIKPVAGPIDVRSPRSRR